MFDGLFGNKDDVCREFNVQFDGLVIYAWYEYEDYSGSAEVIFLHDGKIFTVSGGHCSCNGLEDQWEPIEMPLAALKKIAEDGQGAYSDGIRNALEVLEEYDGLVHCSDDEAAVWLRLRFG
jgi:hypothetical protein